MKVAVIGAGPAGASTAQLLAEGGISCLLFDGSHPRKKACSGGLDEEDLNSWSLLRRYAHVRTFDGDRLYTTPGGRTIRLPGARSAPRQLVSRQQFDRYLASSARDAGARWIREDVRSIERQRGGWALTTTAGTAHQVDYLVGADGVQSQVRRVTVGPFDRHDLLQGRGLRFEGATFDTLHTYLFDAGVVGFALPAFDAAMLVVAGPAQTPGLRPALARLRALHAPAPANPVPFAGFQPLPRAPSFFDSPRAGEGYLLCGDAAGFTHALTAEGIRYAIASAHAAAAALLDGRPAEYETRWRDTFGPELIDAARKRRLRPPSLVLEMGAAVLRRSPTATVLLHRLIRGRGEVSVR